MSKMSELALEIEDMYYQEYLDVAQIAKKIGLPTEDISAFINELDQQNEYDGLEHVAEKHKTWY